MTNKELVASIKRAFSHLTRFTGRDSRAQFWPFAISVFILQNIVGAIIALSMLMQTFADIKNFSGQVEQGRELGAQQAPIVNIHAQIFPDITPFFYIIVTTAIVMTLLLAAAVTRRLHDTERSGIWALLPLPFLGIYLFIFAKIYNTVLSEPEEVTDDFLQSFALLFANNAIYLILTLILIVFLALPGRNEANRYGPPPTN